MINDQMTLQKLLDLKETPKENEVAFSIILRDELKFFKSELIHFDIELESSVMFTAKIYIQYKEDKQRFLKIFETYQKLECLSHLMYTFSIMLIDGTTATISIYHPDGVDEFGFIKFLKEIQVVL